MTSRGDVLPRSARRPAAPWSHRVVLATGWARRGLALLSGACGALAMAPVGFVPAMAVSLTLAVWLVDGSERTALSRRSGARRHLWPTLRCAFWAGWWWGFGYFTAGLYWLGAAFLVDPDKTAWLMPFGVVGLPAVLAIYAGLAFALARALWCAGSARVAALGFALLVTELLRGWLFTGFPWNEIGMALGSNLLLAQAASVIGLHGLTTLTVPIFAAPATLADRDAAGRRSLAPTMLAAVALIGLAGFGAWRLAGGPVGEVPGVRLRIMQPDVFGDGEFTYENKDTLLAKYLALSDRATSAERTGLADVTHLIWPESPFPFILSRDPDALDAIGRILPKDTVLVTGAARADGEPGSRTDPPRYFNAIQVLGHDAASGAATVGDTYDKVHLVPFGEYTPFMGLMERLGISQFVPIPGGFTPGTRRHLLHVPGLPPVVPAVCYEAIFSGALMPPGDEGLDRGVILNVSDDGWFGRTAGPWQHLAQARLRAIEQGLPLIRAANTGVSAIIDPYGRILKELPLGESGVLDGFLPQSIAPTRFSEMNQVIPPAAVCLLLTVLFIMRYGNRRWRTRSL
jgi:apolipoprotein N-acyltransferase